MHARLSPSRLINASEHKQNNFSIPISHDFLKGRSTFNAQELSFVFQREENEHLNLWGAFEMEGMGLLIKNQGLLRFKWP